MKWKKLDVVWKVFWYLTVIWEWSWHRQKWWMHVRTVICKCDCGNIKEVKLNSLIKWDSKSCWCMRHNTKNRKKRTKNYIWIIRKKLTVIEDLKLSTWKNDLLCICECWKTKIVNTNYFMAWAYSNCGNCYKYSIKDIIWTQIYNMTILWYWDLNLIRCRCICGKIKDIKLKDLKRWHIKWCWCATGLLPTWKDHPNYNHEISDEDRLLAKNRKLDYNEKKWSMSVKARDGYICKKCGINNNTLESHHINNWRDYIDLRYDVDNGLTLCHKCHMLFHKEFGRRNNNNKQMDLFLQKYYNA